MLDHGQLISLIKKEIKLVGSQKQYALKHHISQQYLNDVIHNRREPGVKILMILGYQRVVRYKRVYDMQDQNRV